MSRAGASGVPETTGRAKRSLGQNFLRDPNVVRRIVAALELEPGGRALEIGPGRGALCGEILERSPGAYVALEKDADLAFALKAAHPRISVVYTDALRFDWKRLDAWPGVRIAGNLPYNIASPLMWDIISQAESYASAVFMVQYEVARRVAAAPGAPEYGGLSAWLQSFAKPRILFKVSPNAFVPRPKVDSAVVRFKPLPAALRPGNPGALARLIKMCFQMRRKQARNILKAVWSRDVENLFEINGFTEKSRPEEFPPIFFQQLADVLKNALPS